MAAALQRALGIKATLVEGDRGEFTVWVDSLKVAAKEHDEFPSDAKVVGAVRGVLQ